LTSDEYDRYIEVNAKIAEMFPSLVSGYDSQNNAILNLGKTAEQTTEKL